MQRWLLFCFVFSCFGSSAQVGDLFPSLSGETLEGNHINLPEDVREKMTLVGLAYSKKAEETLKTWYTPTYDKFVLKRGMFDYLYDVNIFFIPMFTGAKKAAYNTTIKKLKESNRTDLFPYILFYKGKLGLYEETLKLENKNLPYFFLINEKGKVVLAMKGLFSDQKMEKIEAILDSE